MQPYEWITDAWIAFLVIWLIAAVGTKRTTRTQPAASRMLQGGLAAAGAVLLFARDISSDWLTPSSDWVNLRVLPDTLALAYTGAVLTIAGIAFAVWARFAIGRNWSGVVTIKQDHELIRSGPYALVRHPIYSGMLLAVVGTALAVNELRGLMAIVLATAALWLKSRTEEGFMLQQFGDQYREYQQQVKALIPFVL